MELSTSPHGAGLAEARTFKRANRPGAKAYVVVDIGARGKAVVDEFTALTDAAAVRRAQFAAQGIALEVWRDEQLLGRWLRNDVRKRFTVALPAAPRLADEDRPPDVTPGTASSATS